MANVQITQLPNAQPLTGNEQVPVVQSGITVKTTVGDIAAAYGPSLNASFILTTSDPTFPNSRYLSVSSGLSLTDNGPLSNIVLGLTAPVSSLISVNNGILVKDSPTSLINRTITAGTVGLSVSNGNGVSGNPTISLTGLPLSLAQLMGSGIISYNGSVLNPRSIAGTSGQINVANGSGASGNPTISLDSTAVTPGSYTNTNLTVDQFGRITSATNGTDVVGVTSIATGFGLLGGPITTTGTIYVDTSSIATLSTPQTLTNKSINGSSNTITNIDNASLVYSSLTINGTPISLGGSATIASSISTLTIGTGLTGGSFNGTSPITIAIDNSVVATLSGSQTLTNKTISGASNTLTNIPNASLDNSAITINGNSVSLGGSISISSSISTLTIGTGLTGGSFNGSSPVTIAIDSTVVTESGSQTLTNKTISGSSNTLSNIGNSSLSNSSLTINGTSISLGGSATVTAVNPNSLTIGTGLTGTSYNGSSAVTIAIDSSVVTESGSQTLTNKTISGANNTLSNIGNSSLSNSSITIGTTSISLGSSSLTLGGLTTVTLTQDPTSALQAATKQYVDTLVSSGITYHLPVKYEVPDTTGNLTATYNNGVSGVGATLTNAGTQVAFAPDGPTASIGDRILIYNQTNAYENGVYEVSVVGNGSTNWVLTRTTDTDSYGLKDPNALGNGDAFFVTSGNTGAGETYVCNTVGVINFGTTNITFVQVSSSQVYQAGTGLNLSPATTFNISNTGVVAATYGSSSSVPSIAVNAQGQITSASNTAIAIDGNQITSGTVGSSYINGSYTGITGVGTLTAGTWNANTIGAGYGGTGLNSYTSGDIIYATGSTSLSKLGIGSSGYVLTSGGSAPQYVAQSTLSVGSASTATTATNLAGGANGSLPYQTGSGATTFLAAGTDGYVLTLASGVPTWAASSGGVSSFQTNLSGLTPNTSTTGAITLSGTLGATSGGTSQSTYATGDILYASASNTLSKLTIGSSNQVLQVVGGVPTWQTLSTGSGTVTDVSVSSANGFAGTVATSTTTPVITLTTSITGVLKGSAGALATATAGTDYSAGTAGLSSGILYSTTSTGALSIASGSQIVTEIGANAVTNATNATNASNVAISTASTNANYYMTFVSTTTGNLPIYVDAGVTYNPSTNAITNGISGGTF